MSRYFVTFGLLGVVVLWLVLSYAPAPLPQIAVTSATMVAWLPASAAVVLAVFALLQLDLLRATVRMLKHPAGDAEREAVELFNLRLGREVLLTATPLAGTLLLALLLLAI
jgi:hypothetical protein